MLIQVKGSDILTVFVGSIVMGACTFLSGYCYGRYVEHKENQSK